jgi:hypothetical protein
MISESACSAQLRHHNRQDVVIYSALLIHVLPNGQAKPQKAASTIQDSNETQRSQWLRPSRFLSA